MHTLFQLGDLLEVLALGGCHCVGHVEEGPRLLLQLSIEKKQFFEALSGLVL